MPNPERYIAFDAATKTGVAWRFAGKIKSATIDPTNVCALNTLVESLAMCHTCAVIEDCYLGVNPATMKRLAVIQGRIAQACESAGMRVVTIQASTWQAAYKLAWTRVERKMGARKIAKLIGGEPKNQDEADAICLLDFAEMNRS